MKRAYAAIPSSLHLAGLTLGVALNLLGCGRDHPASQPSELVRVTDTKPLEYYPRFSPDGTLIAFSTKDGRGQRGGWAASIVSAKGGEPRRISADSTSQYVIDWTPDGAGLYVFDDSTSQVCRLSLEGSIDERYEVMKEGHVEDASPEGDRFLAFQPTRSGFDAGILERDKSGEFTPLKETPELEIYGTFGPRKDQVTVCQLATSSSPTSTIAIWSSDTRSYAPLTLPRGSHQTPTWSSDGRFMAYTSNASGNRDLWIYERESGRAIQATRTPEDEREPHASPDGSSVAFARESRTSHLFMATRPGEAPRQITEGPDLYTSLIMSRDGNWIAFLRRSSTEAVNKPRIFVMSLTDSVMHPLELGDLEPQTDRRHYASWSPDNRELVLAASDPSGNTDIYRVPREPDGTPPSRITIDPGIDVEPSWSPDGRSIAYLHMGEGQSEIWVVPAHGGIARRVSQSDDMCMGPVWAWDSNRLAYHVAKGLMRYEIWMTSADHPEGARRVLPEKDQWVSGWGENGERILVARLMGEKRYAVDAVSLDGKNRVLLGDGPEKRSEQPFMNVTPEAQQYFNVLYPGGRSVFPDGEVHKDIYILRVKDLLTGKTTS
ncbi:MAG TPA: hypothetical protein VFP10_11595 [Candidatus Eisenbacteria bacterium]|nr:hypothetical protein [Candidatus Eisenbacteria bacterium]